MPFIVQSECPCCRDKLHHCKKCWNQFHSGKKHGDYEPPKHYGESMFNDDLIKTLKEAHGIEHNPNIKEDKNREYKEGEYH